MKVKLSITTSHAVKEIQSPDSRVPYASSAVYPATVNPAAQAAENSRRSRPTRAASQASQKSGRNDPDADKLCRLWPFRQQPECDRRRDERHQIPLAWW